MFSVVDVTVLAISVVCGAGSVATVLLASRHRAAAESEGRRDQWLSLEGEHLQGAAHEERPTLGPLWRGYLEVPEQLAERGSEGKLSGMGREVQRVRDRLRDQLELIEAIGELEEREQTVAILYYYEGLTLKEIGKALNLSEIHVLRIRHRSLTKLRKSFPRSARAFLEGEGRV